MPTYFIIDGVKIELYFKDHNPPHFHALISEHDAMIEIATQNILRGNLPNTKRKKILKWAEENQTTLMAIWENLKD
jgi:hypothetical protein